MSRDHAVAFRGVGLTGSGTRELSARILAALESGDGLSITFMNPHSFNLLDEDSGSFAADLRRMDLICVDGIGVVWAIRVLLGVAVERVSFDLLAPTLLAELAAAKVPVHLVGGRPGVATAAAAVISRHHPALEIVAAEHGYVAPGDHAALIRRVEGRGARVVLVGAGAPHQERLAAALRAAIPGLVVITCGGYFDQVTKPGPIYPPWAYPLRINWLVRLAREPRRLWRRYLLGNPRFVLSSAIWRARRR